MLPQSPMCYESTGVWVRDAQNETRLIFLIFWFGKPPHTHRYAHARTHTHTFTHTHTHTYNLLEQSSYSRHCLHPRGEPGAMEVAETASHLQMFFFSQKSWSLISVLSKPTTQHHYSDFLLLPMNLPFIHCLKKKKQKQSAPSLIPTPPTQMLVSLLVLTLFSGFQVLFLEVLFSPASIMFIFPNLTVMDQVLCGIEKSMYQ